MIVHLLNYIGVDYPGAVAEGKVIDEAEYAEQIEFAAAVKTQLTRLPDTPDRSKLIEQAEALIALVKSLASAQHVAAAAGELRDGLIRVYAIPVAPKRAPDLAGAASLYEAHCASCHGVQGRGDGMLAANLDPRPSDFHDRERQSQLSVYGLYNTITLGVDGTGMRAWRELSDADKWALAFYVANFASSAEERARGETLWRQGTRLIPDLSAAASLSPRQALAALGDEAPAQLAYVRANPQVLETAAPGALEFTAAKLRAALQAYEGGDKAAAEQLAVAAYLDGFELVEARLSTVDAALMRSIEREMMALRAALKAGASLDSVRSQANAINALLQQAQAKLEDQGIAPASNGISAFVILLREGLEAILILGGIVAFLIRTQRRAALAYVHAGWIGALGLGVITWFVATYVIAVSGASRELTEGITALIAAAVLLYVGYWLHGKIYAQRWNEFIRSQLQQAMKSSTLWGLALLSFLTVYREVFETVLFYQALWTQAGPAGKMPILYGFFAAVATLSVIAWLVFTFGVRLPLKTFFGVSSVLIGLLAIVFIGKGIAALQEAGKLPLQPIDAPSVPSLGIYPNLQGVLLQVIVLALVVGSYGYAYYSSRRAERMHSA